MSQAQSPRPSLASRLRHSRLARLGIGLAILGLIFVILAFLLTRVLGPQDRFEAFSLPYAQDFVDVDLKRWFTDEGAWSIRDEMLAQSANLEKPAQTFVPQKLAPDQSYHLSTYLTLAKNTQSAGIDFNAQYPKLTEKHHRVSVDRKEDDSIELVAGYTDENGAFVRQVAVPLDVDTQDYRLDLYVLDKAYTVQVNGQTLIAAPHSKTLRYE